MRNAAKIRTLEVDNGVEFTPDVTDLICKVKAGDTSAWNALWKGIEPYVTGVVSRELVGNSEVADVVQEVAIRVLKSTKHFRGEAKFTTWLYRIAHNECATYWNNRNRKRSKEDPLEEDGEEGKQQRRQFGYSPCVLEQMILREVYDRFKQHDRQIINLYYVKGVSREDIAQMCGCSTRHVDYVCEKFMSELDKVTNIPLRRKRSSGKAG